MSGTKVHWRLLTVNKAPERAKILIGRMIDGLKDRYDIEHLDNCSTMDDVLAKVVKYKPNVMFCASMWQPAEADAIFAMAKTVVPDVKTHAIPTGLQVERGPDAIVEHLLTEVPKLLDA